MKRRDLSAFMIVVIDDRFGLNEGTISPKKQLGFSEDPAHLSYRAARHVCMMDGEVLLVSAL